MKNAKLIAIRNAIRAVKAIKATSPGQCNPVAIVAADTLKQLECLRAVVREEANPAPFYFESLQTWSVDPAGIRPPVRHGEWVAKMNS